MFRRNISKPGVEESPDIGKENQTGTVRGPVEDVDIIWRDGGWTEICQFLL
jgi:hypothetical protein